MLGKGGITAYCCICELPTICTVRGCDGQNKEGHYHTCNTCTKFPQFRQLFARVESLEREHKELVERLSQ